MADRLSQLQESLDQLLTQMSATIHYIDTRHPHAIIPGQTEQNPWAKADEKAAEAAAASSSNPKAQQQQQQQQDPNLPPRPPSPGSFHATLQELAQDLVLKELQIEVLIDSLPGLGNSQEEQEKRIEELEEELKGVEVQRKQAAREKEELLRRVEGRILGARRL